MGFENISDSRVADTVTDFCKFALNPIIKVYRTGQPNRFKSTATIKNGLSSTSRYAVVQRAEIYQLYTPDPATLANRMTGRGGASEVPPNENPGEETDRFENIVLISSKRPVDYFDVRIGERLPWASPLQTWLELMRGDKRDRETADQVRELLLKNGDLE